ncbi:MAG: PIN domain-containing protein, partial [Atopobiaceae bacterium]|nr:PIN domain-containing protein [Atopobiaceae bacterium]
MKLLVDTNVLIDGYLKRSPFYEDWKEIRLIQMMGDIELWASAKSFTDVHYVASRYLDSRRIQRAFLE